MIPESPIPPDDPIARATDALKRADIPDGPTPETLARTLAALRAAADRPDISPRPRSRIMFALLKTAAAIVTAAVGVAYFAAVPPASATAEFVEAAQKLERARTLSFHMTMTIAGIPEPMGGRVLYKVPGLCRNEPEKADGMVSILDLVRGKALLLNPSDKSAMLLEQPAGGGGPARRPDPSAAMIESMRQLADKDGQPAGERVIGGVRARGFRVKEQGQGLTIWVDPEKKLPVLVEFAGRSGNIEFRGSYSDIRIDPELDDAMFRLEPPAGYALRKAGARLTMTPEEAVAHHLRSYAEASGGRFPARLDDLDDWRKVVGAATRKKADAEKAAGKKAAGPIEPRAIEAAVAGARLAVFCEQMKGKYGYKPDGVKLGDARTILFWYKPEGEEKYKIVYGDLHIGETAEVPAP